MTDTQTAAKPVYSKPVIEQTLALNTLHAQRVVQRDFKRTMSALYRLDVIVRVVAGDDPADQLDALVSERLNNLVTQLTSEQARLTKLLSDNGIQGTLQYSAPQSLTVNITSPQVAQFVAIVRRLDDVIQQVDALWLAGLLTNKQRNQATLHWQHEVQRIARKFVALASKVDDKSTGEAPETSEHSPTPADD